MSATNASAINRRAGGRRHYNLVRQMNAAQRRGQVAEQIYRGVRPVDIARALGVDRSTISRDMAALLQTAHATRICPVCGGTYRA